jgi:hypothetical protein
MAGSDISFMVGQAKRDIRCRTCGLDTLGDKHHREFSELLLGELRGRQRDEKFSASTDKRPVQRRKHARAFISTDKLDRMQKGNMSHLKSDVES